MHCSNVFRGDKKYYISLMLLFLFMLSSLPCIFAQNDGDRSYSIPYANIDLYVGENGNLHVIEKIHYSFTGTYHGVYRNIPIKSGQNIENLKISTNGAYSSYQVNKTGNMESLKIFVYSDSQKTVPIADKDVDVFIEYDFTNVIKIYNDIAELQYKLWGEGWNVSVGQVNANIHLKSNNGIQYWLNPPYFTKNDGWQNGTLKIETEKIPSGKYFEVRMAIPKDQFAANPTNGVIINQDGLSQIEKIQNEYQNQLNFKTGLYYLLAVLFLLACFIPLLIYLGFGKEPKIDYSAEYERDLPTDDPPAVVNAIAGEKLEKEVGKPDMDGFRATIMDLINRKYLVLSDIPAKLQEDGDHSLSLKIDRDKNGDELRNFEIDVIDFLSHFEEEGVIYLDRIKDELKGKDKSFFNTEGTLEDQIAVLQFIESYKLWKKDLKNEFLDDETMKKIFIKKGDTYLKIFAGVGLIVAIVTFFAAAIDPLPAANYALISSVILGSAAMTSLIMPQKIAGQWTTYGEEYDAKWHNFAKYIQDFSLIKEYPPESIKIWDKYLVYATALGIADNVRKSMEMALPEDKLARSDLYMFHYYGGYTVLSAGLAAGMKASMSGGAGGAGGIGGGAGGGGGGAF